MAGEKSFTVTVDGEEVEIPRKNVTPRQILEFAELDPTQRYLIERRGNRTISYRDNPDEEITVHQNQIFLTGRLGPVAVAFAQGSQLFAAQLRDLGYEVTVDGNWVEFDYEVPGGRYSGATVRKAISVPPNFPSTPPKGFDFKPRFPDRPVNEGAQHPLRSHPSDRFGRGGEHWSRPHPSWNAEAVKDARAYLAWARTLWMTS